MELVVVKLEIKQFQTSVIKEVEDSTLISVDDDD
jgi:hypothetical protein